MSYPTSTTQSTRNKTVSPVTPFQLNTTQNNKAFYINSGEITVDTNETTMISVGDVGERDIIFCFTIGQQADTNANYTVKVKSNGTIIFADEAENSSSSNVYGRDYKFILSANTSIEITLKMDAGSYTFTIAGYGDYL